MEVLHLLRRLAEQHEFSALRDGCLDANADDASVQVLFAVACAHLGDAPTAHRVIAPLDRSTLSLDARADLGAAYIALGDVSAATSVLEALHSENAEHGPALARLAWCRLREGDRDEALDLYSRSARTQPSLAAYEELIRLHRDAGRLPEMAECLDAACEFWSVEQVNWPDHAREIHDRQLRHLRLDLSLARDRIEAAEDWVELQRDQLTEDDWCELLSAFAQALASRDRHAQAEDWLRLGLRRYPKQTLLYDQLAHLAQLQGRTHEALALLQRAIDVAETQGLPIESLWVRLSATALHVSLRTARTAAERASSELDKRTSLTANEMTEGRAEVELALADVEAHEENVRAAEDRYRRVLAMRPTTLGALEGLGRLCLQLGRIDEAVELFELVASIDPTRGHTALISARHYPTNPTTLRRLEQLAHLPTKDGSVRASLLFQLAAAWEKRGDFDKAFALADEANKASRRLLHYAPKVHREHCARIRHAFPKALYENRPGCGHETTLPVFIVGMPRSGTSLVEQVIAGHSQIHGAGELGTIPRVIAGLERWERHTGSGRHYPDCIDDLDSQVARGIAENVMNELREYAPDADYVVDKLPHNFENIGLIKLLFPNARIISVRRDIRDIAISSYFLDFAAKHRGMGYAYHLEWIGEQSADHALLMDHWNRVFPNEILEVRYEDVVDDPARSARRMLDYIGVGWEPQVVDFHALQRTVKTASLWQVRQPLYSSSKGRWQHYRQHLQPTIAVGSPGTELEFAL